MSNPRNFLSLSIPFSQQNHCSVFFAHLQNTLSKLAQTDKLAVDKISHILADIYGQHQKLEQSYDQLCKSTKDMMQEFSVVLAECKEDREKLMKATQDRHDMLQKLRETNDDAIQVSNENVVLKETVAKLKEINGLLGEKMKVIQEQVARREMATLSFQAYASMNKEYDRLLNSNIEIKKQLEELSLNTEIIDAISAPLQVINNALSKNSQLKQQIWQEASSDPDNLSQIQAYKDKFFAFNFEQIMKKLKK